MTHLYADVYEHVDGMECYHQYILYHDVEV